MRFSFGWTENEHSYDKKYKQTKNITCAWAALEVALNNDPNIVPIAITVGTQNSVTKVICGEIINKEAAQPIICVLALKPPEIVCLKLLLKSWTSEVNLKSKLLFNKY